MSERSKLISALVAEVLGPRGGPNEVLGCREDPLDPLDEYLTGVLAPCEERSEEIDSEQELGMGDSVGGIETFDMHDQRASSIVMDRGQLQFPSLDPTMRPSSMGISFIIQSDDAVHVDICASVARYEQREVEGGWQRCPVVQIWEGVDVTQNQTLSMSSDSAVSIEVLSSRQNDSWKVSVFLVNRTVVDSKRRHAQAHLFQPQLRINCGKGSKLLPFEGFVHRDDDDEIQSLDLLHGGQRPLARGHLTSVIWRDIDLECHDSSVATDSDVPLKWIDGIALLGDREAQRFSPADIRTDYVPIILLNSPDQTWIGGSLKPELCPSKLCELVTEKDTRLALEPLVDGYSVWIKGQKKTATELPVSQQAVANKHLAQCESTLERLRIGTEMVACNDDVRLAFCFANKAIAMQSKWTKKRVNTWWPFQLAFQLLNIPSLVDRNHVDRETCDLLWFPTGGGKTEAYLGLAAFAMAYRRLRDRNKVEENLTGAGVSVLSRYTLRLLTIQQFRRALALVTACEVLRCRMVGNSRGWRPENVPDCGRDLWGGTRFSIGLWVGGQVTPNNLQSYEFRTASGAKRKVAGAIDILENGVSGSGDPAQVLNCPACQCMLAVPPEGFHAGDNIKLHLLFADSTANETDLSTEYLSDDTFEVIQYRRHVHEMQRCCTLSLRVRIASNIQSNVLDAWVANHVSVLLGDDAYLVAARASRPGYFIRRAQWGKRKSEYPVDFEIFCPNPECDLNSEMCWHECTPAGPWPLVPEFALSDRGLSRCPIPAWTVDEQIYHRVPSMIVSTVDKFARLAFEPRAATLFGNVEQYNDHLGYYRSWCPPRDPTDGLPKEEREGPSGGQNVPVLALDPPDMMLQDELHLIEGPLGSLVGLYEVAIDNFTRNAANKDRFTKGIKYIASTATVRNASSQVEALYARGLNVFPPPEINASTSFFAHAKCSETHPLLSDQPGRLYVGIIAPGRGGSTPIVRVWARLLQHALDRRCAGAADESIDPYWTVVGYFNTIYELAGAIALTRQDIIQRLDAIGSPKRNVEDPVELSSRVDSMDVPAMLSRLDQQIGNQNDCVDIVAATSMFGTGVDVNRLGLMTVNGQPKTTASYIQATGRVGRNRGGVVVNLYRVSRPRDLNHYEYFAGYHLSLHKHVEPITVTPFAPGAIDRALGPVIVSMLRQSSVISNGAAVVDVPGHWRAQQQLAGRGVYCQAHEMSRARHAQEVLILPELFEARAQKQPQYIRPASNQIRNDVNLALDRWYRLAVAKDTELIYSESGLNRSVSKPVVLGTPEHAYSSLDVVYDNAPNSLREVESATTICGRRK